MQSPFSPFVHRRQPVKNFKRRQSELPSDLIDWDAPEIPEVEKQRIIYEEFIKESNEDHVIETLINEEVFTIAHETMFDSVMKQVSNLMNQNNLLLNQHKIFEDSIKERDEQFREVEEENKELKEKYKERDEKINGLTEENNGLKEENKSLKEEIEELNEKIKELNEKLQVSEFRIKELEAESSGDLDMIIQKRAECQELKRKLEMVENRCSFLKKQLKETKK